MVITNEKKVHCQLLINLETFVNDHWDHLQEIKCRIEKARDTFLIMSKLFESHNLKQDMQVRSLRCYVVSILCYGMKAWTLTERIQRKLEAFEM
ncbi:hypothetical protein Trydic_g9457 [Trypoxylus dichotomus]